MIRYFTGLFILLCISACTAPNHPILEINTHKLSMQLGWNKTSAQLVALLSLPEKTVLTSSESQSLFALTIRREDGEKCDSILLIMY